MKVILRDRNNSEDFKIILCRLKYVTIFYQNAGMASFDIQALS